MVPAAPWEPEVELRRRLGGARASGGSAGQLVGQHSVSGCLGKNQSPRHLEPLLSHHLSRRVKPAGILEPPLGADHQPPGPAGAQSDFSQPQRRRHGS